MTARPTGLAALAGVRAAIIDLDGTMLDTVPDFHVAINRMRAEFDLAAITQEQIALMVGKGSENLVRAVLALDYDAAGVAERFDAAMDAYQRHYLAINGQNSSLYFDVVYGGDSLPRKKPDPLPLLTVCRDFDLPAAQVVAIGDSSNDAQAARAAGCPVLTVPYGYNHGESIHAIDSDGIVDTLLDAANQIRLQN